jgi:tetratricopeptide (TPR) repeat protein
LNRQDRAALEALSRGAADEAKKLERDAPAQHRAALAYSYMAQAAMELGDKRGSADAAEEGMPFAETAAKLEPDNAEYRRVLGTLCGQVIPGNVMRGLRYGGCALREVEKAVSLDPESSAALVSRGVGNYYMPPAFGGGVEKAIADFERAAKLNPKDSEARLWLGVALREAGRNNESRAAIQESLRLNPARLWARQQLEKTPAE